MAEQKAKKVLLIGWDAADWKVIDPLIQRGLMPTLSKFLQEGVRGNIATLDPPLSPMLWTSIATGKRADKHGILGFVEPDSITGKVRPVSTRSRKVRAVWNMLNTKGFKSNVVGWWPSNPAEPINGCMVSNFYQQERKGKDVVPMSDWEMPAGTIHPKRLTEQLKELRVHPHEITGNLVTPFVPRAVELDQKEDYRLSIIQRFIAHMSSIHAASTELMEHEPWDFMAVYHDAIDHFSHAFMKFHPPKMDGIGEEEFDMFKDVVSNAYRFHDMMLERTLQLAGDDTTIIIVSDHGFHSDHLRPTHLPDIPAGPAIEHSPYGIFAAKGPGIRKGEQIFGASILDITPTLLNLFGLPHAADMDGKPLLQIFEEKPELAPIDSWENVAGDDGSLPSDMKEDPFEAAAAMQQLIDLGYIDAPGEDEAEYKEKVIAESQLYLAQTYMSAARFDKARPLLEGIYNNGKGEIRFGLELLVCYHRLGLVQEGTALVSQLRATNQVNEHYLTYYDGRFLVAEGKVAQALPLFEQAKKHLPESVEVNMELGKLYNAMQRWHEAAQLFERILIQDSNNAYANHGVGVSLLRMERYEGALDSFLAAIETRYHYPFAHYYLGETLAHMGEPQHAANAFQVAIAMEPGLKKAYNWLVDLYQNELSDPQKADHFRKLVQQNVKGSITTVSGVAGSGMNLIMEMLEAGGASILKDDSQKSYDYEKVHSIAQNNVWLANAVDKSIKISAPFLANLPASFDYKIIYLERSLDTLLTSHLKMQGKDTSNFPVELAQTLQNQDKKAKSWIMRQPNPNVLFLDFEEVVNHPNMTAINVANFVGGNLNITAMTNVVHPTLRRSKASDD